MMSEAPILPEEREENLLTRCLQKRNILAFMGFWCFVVMSALRVSINLAIVSMVNWKEVREKQGFNTTTNESCQFVGEERPDSEDGPFAWQPELQGHILGCYSYGFAATQLVGKCLAELSSPKFILLLGTFITATCTLLVPVAASDGAYVLMLLQILNGFGQGIIMPSFIVIMDKWIPPKERTRFIACIISGIPIGGFLTVIFSGLICKIPLLGWKYVFYVFGAMGAVWCLFWALLIHDSPESHPSFTSRELNRYISAVSQEAPQGAPVPVKSILSSKPVWAYIVAGSASIWCLNLYASVIPLFMGTVLKFDIVMNGSMSAIPHLVEAFFLVFASLVSDHLQKKNTLSATAIRKITMSIGLCGCAICLMLVTFIRCDRILSVVLLDMALGMSGFNFVSTEVIPFDLSPRFAGTISGIMNTIAALSGAIIPGMIGYLTQNRQTMDEWCILFYVSATICLFAFVIFLLFGSSEVQPWNNLPVIQSSQPIDIAQGGSSPKDGPGPSSQAPLITKEEKEKGKDDKESQPVVQNEDRPWRSASFPEIKVPPGPIVFIPLTARIY